ncbi:hypothetical protein ABIA39_008886 [Nocardia sp. GAS34]|uniref:hypothetical protein n=1 Tax=unclassified Nocardia TaxID=2637762 RepID=UPI003D25B891
MTTPLPEVQNIQIDQLNAGGSGDTQELRVALGMQTPNVLAQFALHNSSGPVRAGVLNMEFSSGEVVPVPTWGGNAAGAARSWDLRPSEVVTAVTFVMTMDGDGAASGVCRLDIFGSTE